MSYDVIVIGSGIGGLTSAGLLARTAGKQVLVLERHTEPGGLTHTFRRDGASWDVGVHYIGQVGPGSRARTYFDYLSGGELEWNRMPDAYDRFVYPGLDLSISSDPDRYERDLVTAFPRSPEPFIVTSRMFAARRRGRPWASFRGWFPGRWRRSLVWFNAQADEQPPEPRRRTWMPASAPPSSEASWPASGETTVCHRPARPSPCTR